MSDFLSLAGQNLLSPIILSFVLGLLAALARSDLNIPEAVAKGMSIYSPLDLRVAQVLLPTGLMRGSAFLYLRE